MLRRVLYGIFGIAMIIGMMPIIPSYAQSTMDLTEPGTYIVYSPSPSYHIHIMKLDTGEIWNLGIGAWNSYASLCGTTLAYRLSGNIQIRDLRDDTDTIIAQGDYPRFTDRTCATISYNRNVSGMKIFTRPVDGSADETMITPGARAHWNDTGNKFVYWNLSRVWRYDNGNTSQIGAEIISDFPTLSPDGSSAVYTFGDEIWLYRDSTNIRIGTGYTPDWIDDDTLVFRSGTIMFMGNIGASGLEDIVEIGPGETPYVWTVPEPPPPPPEHPLIPQVQFDPSQMYQSMHDFADRITNLFETSAVQGAAGLVFFLAIFRVFGYFARPLGSID